MSANLRRTVMTINDLIVELMSIRALYGDIDIHIDGKYTDAPATAKQVAEQIRPCLARRAEPPAERFYPPNPRRYPEAIRVRESWILVIGKDNSYRGRG